MTDLSNFHLIDLQPEFLKNDPITVALCNAFEPVIKNLAEQLKRLLIYTNIDELPGKLLDEIALGFGVSWYDSSATLEARRQVIKQALPIFRRLGTASSVRDATDACFGESEVQEWFDYQGEPGHFRIMVTDQAATTTKAIEFLRQVENVKNVSSVLDSITLINVSSAALYFGAATVEYSIERSEQIG